MSVKNKVRRCNKEIKRLEDELETYKLSNKRLKEKLDNQPDVKLLENIIKFAITNQIGGLYGAMRIDRIEVDKLQDLKFDVRYESMDDSYIMRVGHNVRCY